MNQFTFLLTAVSHHSNQNLTLPLYQQATPQRTTFGADTLNQAVQAASTSIRQILAAQALESCTYAFPAHALNINGVQLFPQHPMAPPLRLQPPEARGNAVAIDQQLLQSLNALLNNNASNSTAPAPIGTPMPMQPPMATPLQMPSFLSGTDSHPQVPDMDEIVRALMASQVTDAPQATPIRNVDSSFVPLLPPPQPEQLAKRFKCHQCDKQFVREQSLQCHEKIHSADAPTCPYCSKRFARSSNLVQHIRVHTNERPFQCSYCPKKFKQKNTLTVHIRQHTGERPFQCNVCGKTFLTRCNMMIHSRGHTGEKPYRCTKCERRYVSKSGLTSHFKRYPEHE